MSVLDLSGTKVVDLSGVNVLDLSGTNVVDLSGVNVASLNSQFLQVLTELLQNKPQTKADAVALYHSITLQLSAHLVSNLPAVEQKATTMAMWAVEEVEAVSSACFTSCFPKK